MDTEVLNFSDVPTKQKFFARVARLQGVHQVLLKPYRLTRSNRANRYYFSCVVKTFQDFLREQGQFFDKDEIHEFLKSKLLPPREVIDPRTGEIVGTLPAKSSDKNSAEFARFVNDARDWLATTFDIQCPDPSVFGVEHRKGAA